MKNTKTKVVFLVDGKDVAYGYLEEIDCMVGGAQVKIQNLRYIKNKDDIKHPNLEIRVYREAEIIQMVDAKLISMDYSSNRFPLPPTSKHTFTSYTYNRYAPSVNGIDRAIERLK